MWARVRAFSEWTILLFALVQLAWSLPLRDEQALALWDISPYFIQLFWITSVFVAAAWVLRKNWGGFMFRLSKRRQFMALNGNLCCLWTSGYWHPLSGSGRWCTTQRSHSFAEIPTPSDKAQMGVWDQYFQYLMLSELASTTRLSPNPPIEA